jgi:hypothetical protein
VGRGVGICSPSLHTFTPAESCATLPYLYLRGLPANSTIGCMCPSPRHAASPGPSVAFHAAASGLPPLSPSAFGASGQPAVSPSALRAPPAASAAVKVPSPHRPSSPPPRHSLGTDGSEEWGSCDDGGGGDGDGGGDGGGAGEAAAGGGGSLAMVGSEPMGTCPPRGENHAHCEPGLCHFPSRVSTLRYRYTRVLPANSCIRCTAPTPAPTEPLPSSPKPQPTRCSGSCRAAAPHVGGRVDPCRVLRRGA